MRYFTSMILIMLAGFVQISFGQMRRVSGKVTSSSGTALENVSIRVKSTEKGTLSDKAGVFSIMVGAKDILLVTYMGYKAQTVNITGDETLYISLEPAIAELMEVVMVGARGGGRVKTESPVPVDVINVNQANLTSARPDLMSQLNMAVPSFNYNKQSGGDGSDAIDFASLRGLGFDQTLVLINGKRRHLSAFVNQVGTRGRGNSGTDLNAIPEASIDRVEILRDGASAQYGSDAIAGVINLILKKDIGHLNINIGGSGYYDHKYNSLNSVDPSQFYTGSQLDGKTGTIGISYGLPVGKHGGFINLSGNFLASEKTFRAEPDTSVSKSVKALPVNVWRRAFGDGAVTSAGGMVNAEIPLAGTKTTFYFFGGYNYKLSNVYAWTRNFSNPNHVIKYPTDQQGNLIFVPDIMRKTKAGNVFYNPQENVHIRDGSFALGFKGTLGGDWDWDFSNVTGENDFHYYGHKTFNASLLPSARQATKTDFNDGGFSFLQNTANLDLSKRFSSVAHGLTLSMGAEFRYERYKLYKGELESYNNGGAYIVRGTDTAYKASGSQGYPGYQPSDEADAHRTNAGVYVDAALDIIKDWLLEGALRFENYSDFGFVNTQKLATRYKLSSTFNLRGSISTGFRAPSLQQLNFSNTNTNIIAGQLVYAKLSPNYGPITAAAQIPKLTEEKSVNASLGFNWKPVKNITFTVDGYLVKLKNRIVGTGYFDASIPALAPYLKQYQVGSVNFFANAVGTTNTGVDVVVDYTKRFGKNKVSALLAGNVQNIHIDKINIPGPLNDTYAHRQAFFSTREEYFLKASAPRAKFSLALEYAVNKFSVGTHLTYFGKLTTQGFGYSSVPGAKPGEPGGAGISDQGNGWDPYVTTDDGKSVIPENFIFHGKVTTDVYVSYKLAKSVNWNVGVDNVFNVHPDKAVIESARNASWGDSESGGPFDPVQMGFNGLRMFTKIAFSF